MEGGSYELRIEPSARRSLTRIPLKSVLAIEAFMSGPISRTPRRAGKPLRLELAGRFSARVGPYRVVHWVDDDSGIVAVIRIEHRSGVYRPR